MLIYKWTRILGFLLMFSMLDSLEGIAQNSVKYGKVVVERDCIWMGTPAPSVENHKIAMFLELRALSQTVPVFTLYRVKVLPGPAGPPGPSSTGTPVNSLVFERAVVASDFLFSLQPGEKSCVTVEYDVLAAIVGLNNGAVDAVLTKYNLGLTSPTGAMLFPR